jgi:hypothetical protein
MLITVQDWLPTHSVYPDPAPLTALDRGLTGIQYTLNGSHTFVPICLIFSQLPPWVYYMFQKVPIGCQPSRRKTNKHYVQLNKNIAILGAGFGVYQRLLTRSARQSGYHPPQTGVGRRRQGTPLGLDSGAVLPSLVCFRPAYAWID